MNKDQSKRWALVCARAFHEGKLDMAADVVATLAPGLLKVTAGQSKTHKLDDDSGQFLKDLKEILDETGFTGLLKCSEKRLKELERLKPSMHPVTL